MKLHRPLLVVSTVLASIAIGAGVAPTDAHAVTTARSSAGPGLVFPQYVYLSVSTTGDGSVTSLPAGIDCGADCSETYNYEASACAADGVFCAEDVTLIPHPDLFWAFDHWEGGCNGRPAEPTCTVTMSGDRSITAVFTPVPINVPGFIVRFVTVNKPGTGSGTVTSSPGGLDCGAACTYGFPDPTEVTLFAIPSTGSVFTSWGAACAGTSATSPCVLTLTGGNLEVDAVFSAIPSFLLSITKDGSGSGTVASSPPGVNCGLDCSESYQSGIIVGLAATPDAGSSFGGFSGGPCTFVLLSPNICRVTMDTAKSVTATFLSGGGGGCTIKGTNGPDNLVGTPGDDVICAKKGNDTILGLGGNDLIKAGKGRDIVKGGPGDDDLRGQKGRDRLIGGSGNDSADGGPGNDICRAEVAVNC